MRRVFILLMLFIGLPVQAASVEVLTFESPEQEAQYHTLIKELRCLVCQNQNLADSNAELAQDLRRQTYDMVRAGKSSQEIADYMVARYGDFVLYRPRLSGKTLLLWTGPALFLLAGGWLLWRLMRDRRQIDVPDAAALQRAHDLLNEPTQKHKEDRA